MDQVLKGQYRYEPLLAEEAVRILVLEPADDFRSPLRCSITQRRRTIDTLSPDGCNYSAVSYTWGKPELSHKLFIRLNSQLQVYLRITASVNSLLRHFRGLHEARHLWIDAICLNQMDKVEKSQQIPLMGQIYRDARQVLIWLGHDYLEDVQKAFSLVRRIEIKTGSQVNAEDVQCLEIFFNRPWFNRRWVIQEVFFSHDAIFQCGFHTLGLSRLMSALEKINIAARPNLLGCGSRMLLSSIGRRQEARPGLLSLLWEVHESDCSDPRDRVAAVYSIASDDAKPPLLYNLRDWKDMYKDLALQFLRDTRALAACAMMLHLCAFGSVKSKRHAEYPVWVPDWSLCRKRSLFCDRIVKGDIIANSHLYYDYHLKFRVFEKKLQIICDPWYFQYSGVADLVIRPLTSRKFWQGTIERIESIQTNSEEIRHLFKVLEEVLTESPRAARESREVLGYRMELLAEAIYTCRSNPNALGDDCYKTLRDLTWALGRSTMVRVRTFAGYFWAIGPSGLGVGDWLIPAIFRTGQEFTAMICLRPVGTNDKRKQWQYIPREPETGDGFLGFLNEVHFNSVRHFFSQLSQDCLHITSSLVGLATTMDLESIIVRIPDDQRQEVMHATSRAESTAKAKDLQGPIVFDIV